MTLISIILALIIERLGARAKYWQASYYTNQYLSVSERYLAGDGLLASRGGFMVWLLLPVLLTALVYGLSDFVLWQLAFNIAGLLVCFGCGELRALYKGYLNALSRSDSEAATLYALQMGQKRTEEQNDGESFGQTLAWINFRHYCAVLFWFVVLGLSGAVLYALVRTLADRVRAERGSVLAPRFRLLHSLLFWLDWLPARIASLGYLVIGNFTKGTSCWLRYVLDFSVSNRTVVTKTALAAEQIEQHFFGCMLEANCMMKLVKRNVLFFLALIALLTLFGGLA